MVSPKFQRFHTASKDEFQVQLERAADYIKKHYSEDLSLEKLAAIAHFSKYHFHRLFHEYFGETVHDCVRRVRLEHAAHLLVTDLHVSIGQIAEACGFSSSQNFARAFKGRFGFSPTSARKNPDQRMISKIKSWQANDDYKKQLNVEIKELPSYRVAYIRDIGPYRSESNRKVFLRLIEWAVNEVAFDNITLTPIAVGWSDPATTPAGECIFDACVPVSENIKGDSEVRIQYLPGGKFAVLHCECTWETLYSESSRLFYEWLPLSGFQRDERPFFFICYNNPDMNPRKLAIVDICLPVKP